MCPPNMGFTTTSTEPIVVFCSAGVVDVSWSIADVASDLVICDIGHSVILQIEFRLIT